MKPAGHPPVQDSVAMNTSLRRFCGPRAAALVFFTLVPGGFLLAADTARPDVPPSVLKKYDKNKDGALDETEKASWEADKAGRREKERKAREDRLQKYDLNKDGKLSDDEKAAAKLAMEKERTEREMAKGKEKAQERLAREKEEKEKAATAAAAASSENAGEMEGKDATPKEGETRPADGTMMTP